MPVFCPQDETIIPAEAGIQILREKQGRIWILATQVGNDGFILWTERDIIHQTL